MVQNNILNKPKKQKGFSLVEMAITLAVIALLVGGVLTAGNALFGNTDIKTEAQNARDVANSVKKLYQGRNYTITTTAAINGELFPKNMFERSTNPAAQVDNVWGGAVTIDTTGLVANLVGAGTRGFRIQYTNVPSGACVDFVSEIEGHFEAIAINNTNVKTYGLSPDGYDPLAVTTQCGSADTVSVALYTR